MKTITLQYPDNISIAVLVDHLTILAKSSAPRPAFVADLDGDPMLAAAASLLTVRGITVTQTEAEPEPVPEV